MAIPDFQSIFLPLLEFLADGKERSNQEIYHHLEQHFQLSAEERDALLPSGKQRIFKNRAAWAKSYLKQAGLIASPRRGSYVILPVGQSYLQQNSKQKLSVADLMQFESFTEFYTGKKPQKPSTNHVEKENNTKEELTPEEQVEAGITALNNSLKQEILKAIQECGPRFFEKLVLDLLGSMGYGVSRQGAARLTCRGSDEGIDGVINEDKLGLDTIYVQAKRWDNPVGRPEIQKFAGALQGKRAKKGVFITTAGFTREAQDFVERIDSKIVLIDGEALAGFMIEHNVGVTPIQTFSIKRLDSDYYADE